MLVLMLAIVVVAVEDVVDVANMHNCYSFETDDTKKNSRIK